MQQFNSQALPGLARLLRLALDVTSLAFTRPVQNCRQNAIGAGGVRRAATKSLGRPREVDNP